MMRSHLGKKDISFQDSGFLNKDDVVVTHFVRAAVI